MNLRKTCTSTRTWNKKKLYGDNKKRTFATSICTTTKAASILVVVTTKQYTVCTMIHRQQYNRIWKKNLYSHNKVIILFCLSIAAATAAAITNDIYHRTVQVPLLFIDPKSLLSSFTKKNHSSSQLHFNVPNNDVNHNNNKHNQFSKSTTLSNNKRIVSNNERRNNNSRRLQQIVTSRIDTKMSTNKYYTLNQTQNGNKVLSSVFDKCNTAFTNCHTTINDKVNVIRLSCLQLVTHSFSVDTTIRRLFRQQSYQSTTTTPRQYNRILYYQGGSKLKEPTTSSPLFGSTQSKLEKNSLLDLGEKLRKNVVNQVQTSTNDVKKLVQDTTIGAMKNVTNVVTIAKIKSENLVHNATELATITVNNIYNKTTTTAKTEMIELAEWIEQQSNIVDDIIPDIDFNTFSRRPIISLVQKQQQQRKTWFNQNNKKQRQQHHTTHRTPTIFAGTTIIKSVKFNMEMILAFLWVQVIRIVIHLGLTKQVLSNLPIKYLIYILQLSLQTRARPGIIRVVAIEVDNRIKTTIVTKSLDHITDPIEDVTKIALKKLLGKDTYKFGDITRTVLTNLIKTEIIQNTANQVITKTNNSSIAIIKQQKLYIRQLVKEIQQLDNEIRKNVGNVYNTDPTNFTTSLRQKIKFVRIPLIPFKLF